MKKIVYLFMILLIFFNVINVLALDECTTSELKRLKELANNVVFKYEYQIRDENLMDSDEYTFKQVYYDVTGFNLSNELIVRLKEDEDVRFTYEEPTIGNFINGETLQIEILAYTKNLCSGRVILTKNIKLPSINVYSLNEECQEYPNFKYCQENGELNISELEFQEALSEYKKELENKKDDDKLVDYKDSRDYTMYVYIGSLILIVGVMLFVIIRYNQKKKDSDL